MQRLGGLKSALFAQHHVQQLDLSVSPVEHLRALFEDMSVQDCRYGPPRLRSMPVVPAANRRSIVRRNYLGTFGIRGDTATTQVWLTIITKGAGQGSLPPLTFLRPRQIGHLSGGQRSRVSLATLTRSEPNLIVLGAAARIALRFAERVASHGLRFAVAWVGSVVQPARCVRILADEVSRPRLLVVVRLPALRWLRGRRRAFAADQPLGHGNHRCAH